jgi:CRP-like cAMP-binding protein
MVLEEHGTYRRFAAGETIFSCGDEGQQMCVVDSGQVEIVGGSDDHELQLTVLGPEEIFGEMALFGSGTRSATARALVDCGVRVIDKEDIFKIVQDPLARRLLAVLGQRLADVDAMLVQLSPETELSHQQVMDVLNSRSRFG